MKYFDEEDPAHRALWESARRELERRPGRPELLISTYAEECIWLRDLLCRAYDIGRGQEKLMREQLEHYLKHSPPVVMQVDGTWLVPKDES